MKFRLLITLTLVLLPMMLRADPPTEISLPADAKSPIAQGVALPAGRAVFWTSGTVPSLINKDGKTVYERYGDTYTQGVSCLKNIETVLKAQGLSLKDVIYLRVYITPDAAKDSKADYPGWFKAYGDFFNNAQNPGKTARSTVGVNSLVSPDWLIEIEAFAAYPAAKP